MNSQQFFHYLKKNDEDIVHCGFIKCAGTFVRQISQCFAILPLSYDRLISNVPSIPVDVSRWGRQILLYDSHDSPGALRGQKCTLVVNKKISSFRVTKKTKFLEVKWKIYTLVNELVVHEYRPLFNTATFFLIYNDHNSSLVYKLQFISRIQLNRLIQSGAGDYAI